MNHKKYELGDTSQLLSNEEFDIIENFDKAYPSGLKEKRDEENKQRLDRITRAVDQLQTKEQEFMKKQIENMDKANAQKLLEEEQKRQAQIKAQSESQNKLVMQLSQGAKITLDQARQLLIQRQWNLAQVISDLKEQERKETLTMRMIQDFPEV